MNNHDLYREVDRHDLISFDIFDTLILRDVLLPTGIFDVVQHVYNDRFPDDALSDFKRLRIEAERKVRENIKTEVTLDAIYCGLDICPGIKDSVKEIEQEIELALTTANLELKRVYEYALKRGKKVILVSDMYLPQDLICSILNKSGYSNYERLYLSCVIGKRKRTGELFAYVLKDNACSPEKMLHIGDNKHSDFMVPRHMGIDAVHVARRVKKLYHYRKTQFNVDKIQNNVFLSFVSNRCDGLENAAQEIGYSLFGVMLFSFCRWLKNNTRDVHKFFLARDGYMILKVYQTMYPEEEPYLHYLYISRKALRRPNLYNGVPYEMLVEQFPGLREYTIYNVADFCYVDAARLSKDYSSFLTLKPVVGRKALANNEQYKNFVETLKEREQAEYKKQYDNFLKYLAQERFHGPVAVVDVGWRGTAQINISSLVGNAADITGYYFGVEDSESSREFDRTKIRGCFWTWNEDNVAKKSILDGHKEVFESLFLSNEGTTFSYEETGNGSVIPIKEDSPEQTKQDIVLQIQDGAFRFVREFAGIAKYLPDFNAAEASAGIVDFMLYPQKGEMIAGDIIEENYKVAYLAKPKKPLRYLMHPSAFIHDLHASAWRVGFMARLLPSNRLLLWMFHSLLRLVAKIIR